MSMESAKNHVMLVTAITFLSFLVLEKRVAVTQTVNEK
jgi:hypothetical protein